ncbi:putative selenate reductase subunit YgfK [Desulfitobacterium sp.]|uniref:putative selenate reductase subunit YgfK n=1 Tax=Desulfitobacterium sp. TaxID=49981 RepID=UPI002C7BDFFC|nr:putative selenate reductase subunit YgfK [Desulfitobacterium sp.]HVJ50232.1 putative selenate reductase subunit YgfK [Desulfitobacterium sp.]
MSDKMRPIPFSQLVTWAIDERKTHNTIFGISQPKIYKPKSNRQIKLFGEALETPIGPAAGPHTQLAQNIVASYLSGSRFFELKTVQILDALEFPKPCIRAEDECYNTEWSTELTIENAFAEYVKAWFLVHLLQKELFDQNERRFMFNMSVGYNLEGIKSPKVDHYIEGMKDASNTDVFKECKSYLLAHLDQFKHVDREFIEEISAQICTSITLSTMHGCPPAEIEAISKYLIAEKKLNTFVKMNPTLLGYRYVRDTFDQMGYSYIDLKEESFSHDLQYADGVAMLTRLKSYAKEYNREFGVKLSNTLPVRISRGELPGEEMYMSGRSLYPLTINLALRLASEFDGDLKISYSGGADAFNVERIFDTGIRPITVATTLLKSGGYTRFKQMAEQLEPQLDGQESSSIDLVKLKALADSAFADEYHLKEKRPVASRKIRKQLPLTDCFIDPCSVGCPIGQDIPEYIRLVGEGRYQDAFEVIVARNPLPFITGTICNHNCMTKCTRLDYEEPIQIREMKLIAANKGYDSYVQERVKAQPVKTKAKVAVIGAGPSGLAAGYFLAQAGLEVTIMDRRERAGGTVEYVIPDFRISREAIAKDVKLIEKMGVKFEFGVNPHFSLQGLQAQGYTYIYLALGAAKTNLFQLEGDKDKVIGAIPFLEQFNTSQKPLKPGKSVAVIGGGNTAMDAARAALRVNGVEQVYILYRRTKAEMPADREELDLALEEGVVFKECLAPLSLSGGKLISQKMELGQPDESGRRRPVAIAGAKEELAVDTVITAIGELVDYEVLRKNGIKVDEKGHIACDPETLETNVKNVYLGGDALYGPATVVMGIAQGTQAARAIVAQEGLSWKENGSATIPFDSEKRLLQISEKKGVLKEASADLGEAERCLECNTVCNICTEVCPNRANIALATNQILHVDGMCNECGNCAIFCPYAGAPYQDKFTLFWSEEDFENSQNPGFVCIEPGANPKFKVRLDGKVEIIRSEQEGKSSLPEEALEIIQTVVKEYSYLF